MTVGTGPRAGDRVERGDQAAIEQDRRRDPADEVADLGQRLAGLLLALEDELLRRRGIGVDPLAGEAKIDREHHQPLLRAVVEVALDPVQLARLDVEDGRPALSQRLDLAPQLAALGRAEEAGDDAAVEGDHELRQRRRHGQQHGAEHRPHQDDRGVVARQRPERSPDWRAATASYQIGVVTSDSAPSRGCPRRRTR